MAAGRCRASSAPARPTCCPADERDKPIPHDKLLIDVGLPAEELPNLVRVGDLITMNRELIELKGGFVGGQGAGQPGLGRRCCRLPGGTEPRCTTTGTSTPSPPYRKRSA